MMKFDMAGAAAVLGTIHAAAALALPLHIVYLIPAVENLLGEGAYKPGDVLRTLSGQTIEVVNTDCEGRLALADALTYAHRFDPKAIVDVATLTYACIAAFGHMVTGLMTNDPSLATRLQAAGKETAERVWELPIFEDYFRQIRSQAADYKNRGGDPAGAITAAMLLSKFTNGYPWAHLDIAGTAWIEQNSEYPERAYLPASGGTGIGVRLLVNFLERWVNEQAEQASPAGSDKGHWSSSASVSLEEGADTPRLPSSSM